PNVSSFEERAAHSASPAYNRRSSNLPPGLATRGGITEDLLRKQGEAASTPHKPQSERQTRWLQHSVSTSGTTTSTSTTKSISSLAALDLADDALNPIGARATTPLESPWSQFRSGTLRITNGAASPEPSMRAVMIGSRPASPDTKARESYFASMGGASVDILQARSSLDSMPRRMSAESLPIRDRILNSNKGQQQRMDRAHRLSEASTISKESLVSSLAPLQIGSKLSRQSLSGENVSPVSGATTPRFQQRWSHRASQISAEYASDCEISASPYEEKTALLNFATRLSTVFDSDADDAEDGTPEAAL
ncbi:hypothetical protein LTR53_018252, partial [Teratosphaeriaceae sp. CCFEE 6253]